jgi:hypothetical protein
LKTVGLQKVSGRGPHGWVQVVDQFFGENPKSD